MKTIYKYPLELKGEQTIELPYDHRILSVQNQNGTICLCAVVGKDETSISKRNIKIIPTGFGNPDLDFYYGGDMEFIGTVQWTSLVFHVFIDV